MQDEIGRAAGSPAPWLKGLVTGVVAAALQVAAASAETVSVAGQDIVLVAPKRSCVFDRAIIAALEQRNAGKNDVLMVFGEPTRVFFSPVAQRTKQLTDQPAAAAGLSPSMVNSSRGTVTPRSA